jgi:hypothetical protein
VSLFIIGTLLIAIYEGLRLRRGSLFGTGSLGERLPLGSTLQPWAILREDSHERHEENDTLYGENSGDTSPVNGFRPGKLKPMGSNYTKVLVIARTKNEDVAWVTENFGRQDKEIDAAIYVVDDPDATIHPPVNKGHEAMVYLSYIIDYYDELADVNIFMHAHRYAWHNDDILDIDAVEMISRLSPERVQREGYMNMRCHWDPGCPDWIHLGEIDEGVSKEEEPVLAESWTELFPNDPIPKVLAVPCCAQFAVSRDRIRAVPKERYLNYRDWLISTPLSDRLSGRVWEYVWHYLFTGKTEYCPLEHVCYCDGFGVCFGGGEEYTAWWDKMWDKRHFEDELKQWYFQQEKIRQSTLDDKLSEISHMPKPEPGRNKELQKTIMELQAWLSVEKHKAIERGKSAKNRATEAGRDWREGDGF